MILYDVLHLISRDQLPLMLDQEPYEDIDCRPDSVYKVKICFMCEKETWVTTYPENPILVPWYECGVSAISPSDEPNTMEIWLYYVQYLKNKYAQWLCINDQEEYDECN